MNLPIEKLETAFKLLEAKKTRRAMNLPPGVDPAVVHEWRSCPH
jgi:hypothetical protein